MDGYAPKFAKDIKTFDDYFRNLVPALELSKNLYHTSTLCWCFLSGLFESARGLYATMDSGALTAARIINRSMVEHAIDMKLLALRNDETSNSRFANYHKMAQYFARTDIESHKDEIPKIARDYRDYVQTEYPEIVNRFTQSDPDLSFVLPDWPEIDRRIRGKFRGGWSGLTFNDKVLEIRKCKASSARQNRAYQVSRSGAMLERIELVWKVLCNYTHPTAYSTVPKFVPSRGTFELLWETEPTKLEFSEKTALFVILDGANSFALAQPDKEANRIAADIERIVRQSDRLTAFVFE